MRLCPAAASGPSLPRTRGGNGHVAHDMRQPHRAFEFFASGSARHRAASADLGRDECASPRHDPASQRPRVVHRVTLRADTAAVRGQRRRLRIGHLRRMRSAGAIRVRAWSFASRVETTDNPCRRQGDQVVAPDSTGAGCWLRTTIGASGRTRRYRAARLRGGGRRRPVVLSKRAHPRMDVPLGRVRSTTLRTVKRRSTVAAGLRSFSPAVAVVGTRPDGTLACRPLRASNRHAGARTVAVRPGLVRVLFADPLAGQRPRTDVGSATDAHPRAGRRDRAMAVTAGHAAVL